MLMLLLLLISGALIPNPEDDPLVPLWPDASEPFHIKKSRAYQMANNGTFPVRTIKVGGRWFVRTADLRRELGLSASQPQAS